MTALTAIVGAVWQSAPLWLPALLGTLAYAAWEHSHPHSHSPRN